MELSALITALNGSGYPVAYGQHTEAVEAPFLAVQFAYGRDLMADNINYKPLSVYQVELYTYKKQPAVEKQIEAILTASRLPYMKREFWIDSEKLLQIIYEITLDE